MYRDVEVPQPYNVYVPQPAAPAPVVHEAEKSLPIEQPFQGY